MKTLSLLFLVFVLTGCVSRAVYNKPGETTQEFYADQACCNAQAQQAEGNMGGFMGVALFQQNKSMCMAGKGYTCVSENGKSCDPN